MKPIGDGPSLVRDRKDSNRRLDVVRVVGIDPSIDAWCLHGDEDYHLQKPQSNNTNNTITTNNDNDNNMTIPINMKRIGHWAVAHH